MRISTLQLVILVNLSIFVTGALTGSTIEEDSSQNSKSCKTFCEYCGCTGFYCGEECICECNQEDGKSGGTKCIGTVQENAKKMKADFEILIQGPSGNRFLQDAQEFNQNQHCLHEEEGREKRSTVVIYKPTVHDYKDEVTKLHSKIKNLEKAIVKRDLSQRRTKRQQRPKWLQREDSLFNTNFFLKDVNNKTTESLPEKKKQPTKIGSSKKVKNTLANVDSPTINTDQRKGNKPVKRSFLNLGGLSIPKFGILEHFEPLPNCLFDSTVEFAADKLEGAIVLLREAADDLLENISKDLQKKANCFETAFSRKILWDKLISLPGISCLEKLFPKIRLCDLLDPLTISGRPLTKLFLAESIFGDASPLD